MGKRYKDYMRQAEEAYLLEIAEKTNPHDMAFWLNVRRAALEAEIKFPRTLRRRSRRKLFDLTKTLFEEYDQLLPRVQQVKKIENWTVRKLKMAELFKDSTKERIENWCSKSMKPSEVVEWRTASSSFANRSLSSRRASSDLSNSSDTKLRERQPSGGGIKEM
jgi:hypothetical protein